MITWDTATAMNDFWNALSGATVALIMDYDGTLSPFVPNPEEARPYPAIAPLLDQLSQAGCRLVFVTGRDCRQLPAFLELKHPPEVWGSHGGERLYPDGKIKTSDLEFHRESGMKQALSWAETAGYASAVEVKPGCLSFHVRAVPSALSDGVLMRAREQWAGIANTHDLELRAFDGGVELRSPDVHKGLAVTTVLDESTSGTAVFYLGDDQTDEDGFAALKEKGTGILVRPVYRKTQADWWIRPPGELLDFLNRVLIAVSKS